MSADSPGMIVADLFAAAAVVAGVPADEKIHAIRAYPDIGRVEFVGARGVYRTTLDAEIEERHPEVDTSEDADGDASKAPGKAPRKP